MAQKTHSTKRKEITRNWHLIDAKGQVLGKISAEIVTILMGKNKIDYSPSLDMGDRVVVINAKEVVLTGNKEERKVYHWHTGFMGGIKDKTAAEVRAKNATELVTRAVNGMLPKNRLRKVRMANLHVYEGATHPYTAQTSKKSSKGDK